jgi:hypothetical protein
MRRHGELVEDELEPQNPTPGNEGASTLDPLDRIERMLAAQDDPGKPKQDDPADGAATEDVKPEGDGQQSDEPQLTTSDLAKYLGIDEAALDLDEDGTVKLKTKVDGVEGAAKLQDLLKSYQLQEHVDKKSREASEREKALNARMQEAEQQFSQRLQYAENLANVAANQLLQEFQSINWPALEQQDAGQAALLRQKFQEKQAQLRGVFHNIQQEKAQSEHKTNAATQESLQREAARLPELIPEWKDATVAQKERSEIRDWAIKAGYEPSEVDSISKAHHVAVLRKAMLADKLQQSRPEVENRVRTAPKLVKPGQAQQNTQEQSLRNLKQSVQKSGGKKGIEAYLLATGRA